MKIYISEPLVGDSICSLPFLKYCADKDGFVEYGPYLCSWIEPHLPSNFILNRSMTKDKADIIFYRDRVWSYYCSHVNPMNHLIDAYFQCENLNTTIYRFEYPLYPTDNIYDIVISPFASSATGNKIWQYEKWIELIDKLPPYFSKCIICSDKDDTSWIPNRSDVTIIQGQSLPIICYLLKQCKMFVSIDTGTSHLAHVLGLTNHVLLYPHHCAIVENTYSRKYKISINNEWKHITDIPLQPVLNTCINCLHDFEII
jgi:ADP-heptose:LPS heptosyltransferase